MTREEMMDNVIRKFGFEHEMTIQFCTMCESPRFTDLVVEVAYNYLMNK